MVVIVEAPSGVVMADGPCIGCDGAFAFTGLGSCWANVSVREVDAEEVSLGKSDGVDPVTRSWRRFAFGKFQTGGLALVAGDE